MSASTSKTQEENKAQIMDEIRREWHLDRKVTIGIIVALLFNAGSSIWWASRLDYTVQLHDIKIEQNAKVIADMRERNTAVSERLARIEANQQFQNDTLKEIKEAIKK